MLYLKVYKPYNTTKTRNFLKGIFSALQMMQRLKTNPKLPFATGYWTPGSGTDGENPAHGSLQAGVSD